METNTLPINTTTIYVEYLRDRAGEEPFLMHGKRWQFVTIRDEGREDIGVYSFDEDRCYHYGYWRDSMNLN